MLLVAFVDKVVDCGHLVVLVIVYTFLCIVRLESELLNHLKDLRLSRDRVLANNKTFIHAYWLVNLEPSVNPNLVCCNPGIRIGVKHFGDKIFTFFRHEVWKGVLTLKDLLVETRRVRILEG